MSEKPKKRRTEKIGKKMRFDVFKRDLFTCQYCGGKPPDVLLEADHIVAVCEGGETVMENLITACRNCNRGKGSAPLKNRPQSLDSMHSDAAEMEDQIEAYMELVQRRRRREDAQIEVLAEIFGKGTGFDVFDHERNSIRAYFIPKLAPDELENAMYKAVARFKEPIRVWKYFCATCWGMIRDKGGA